MTELVIYRGLPACGKTMHAKAWVAEDPSVRARVNRDDLRWMLHGGGYYDRDDVRPALERRVTVAQDRLIKALLDQGVSVACDDTNLPQTNARRVARIGRYAGATVRVIDMTDVPLEECLRRDAARLGAEHVGEEVIRRMHGRFVAGSRHPLPPLVEEVEPDAPEVYVPREGTPPAIMVDLDGTLCIHNGRSPYDESLVGTDLPNPAVVEAVRAARSAGMLVVFCSGRSEACRVESERWIDQHVFGADWWAGGGRPYEALHMRPYGDRRKDAIVKREIFDREIRDRYDVRFVLDDRRQVVDAWREVGLTVFQVAPGDF